MTPAARVQTAIELLDRILAGYPAEQTLTGWARRSRFAGSKDRAAIRDLVFDALRARRSLAALGGAETGRGLMIGLCRRDGPGTEAMFDGVRYGPEALGPADPEPWTPDTQAELLDIPDWLWPVFEDSLAGEAEITARALQSRAPVHVRVNLGATSVAQAVDRLQADGVATAPVEGVETALVITQGARKLRQTAAYRDGLVELQDASSQAVVAALPLQDGMRVLDYCAGGGGKTLAIAASANVEVFAHDANPRRMADLPERARRAGVRMTCLTTAEVTRQAPFDVILTDVPCSGSGAWRRSPEGKWTFSAQKLQDVTDVQARILDDVAGLLSPSGLLAYATCSVLKPENSDQVAAFLDRKPGWVCPWQRQWSVGESGDGFFSAHLTHQ